MLPDWSVGRERRFHHIVAQYLKVSTGYTALRYCTVRGVQYAGRQRERGAAGVDAVEPKERRGQGKREKGV